MWPTLWRSRLSLTILEGSPSFIRSEPLVFSLRSRKQGGIRCSIPHLFWLRMRPMPIITLERLAGRLSFFCRLDRSGETPRMYPSRCRFKEFYPETVLRRSSAFISVHLRLTLSSVSLCLRASVVDVPIMSPGIPVVLEKTNGCLDLAAVPQRGTDDNSPPFQRRVREDLR